MACWSVEPRRGAVRVERTEPAASIRAGGRLAGRFRDGGGRVSGTAVHADAARPRGDLPGWQRGGGHRHARDRDRSHHGDGRRWGPTRLESRWNRLAQHRTQHRNPTSQRACRPPVRAPPGWVPAHQTSHLLRTQGLGPNSHSLDDITLVLQVSLLEAPLGSQRGDTMPKRRRPPRRSIHVVGASTLIANWIHVARVTLRDQMDVLRSRGESV